MFDQALEKILVFDIPEGDCFAPINKWIESNALRSGKHKICRTEKPGDIQPCLTNPDYAAVIINNSDNTFSPEDIELLSSAALASNNATLITLGSNIATANSDDYSSPCAIIEHLPTSTLPQQLIARVHIAVQIKKLQRALTFHENDNDQERQRYKAFWHNSTQGVIEYDHQAKIMGANPSALSLLGYSQEEIEQHSLFDLFDQGNNKKNKAVAQSQLDKFKKHLLHGDIFKATHLSLFSKAEQTIVVEAACRAHEADGQRFIMMLQDITSRTQNEQRLIRLAKNDLLTGLANRKKFRDFTNRKLTYCKDNAKQLALLFIDIDHFKHVNETMGHDIGDELLVEIGERLSHCVRNDDLVARVGSNDFAITMVDIESPQQVTILVRELISSLNTPYQLKGQELMITASIGISLFPDNCQDLRKLMQNAQTAVNEAKKESRNTYRFFSTEIQQRVENQITLEEALRHAIVNNEFHINYQPQVDATTGKIVGMEALIRWQHKKWPGIGPHIFIPVAEECGLLPAIGKWVLYTACRQAMSWRRDPDVAMNFPISVNLSPKQLVSDDFVMLLKKVLEDTQLPADGLILELTETAVMKDSDLAIKMLNEIDQEGVRISVDDFGTGYSSLNYLRRLPIHTLKIDRSFTKDIGIDQNGEAIVKAIIALAHSLNLQLVAEGVEEIGHVEFLKDLHCDTLQGFYYSRPLTIEQVAELLKQERVDWSAPTSLSLLTQNVDNPDSNPPIH